jgi:predicted transcriptional regulator of viral defense system
MRLSEWVKLVEELKEKGYKVIHVSALRSMTGLGDASLNVALWRLQRLGLVHRVARGWVCLGKCEVWEVVRTAFPSGYISMEWALHYHEIIDQPSQVVTVVWLGKPRKVKSHVYTFELHKISKKLYFGFDAGKMIAEPEKALLDTIYLRGYVPPELNLDLLDSEKLLSYAEKFPKRLRKKVEILVTKAGL